MWPVLKYATMQGLKSPKRRIRAMGTPVHQPVINWFWVCIVLLQLVGWFKGDLKEKLRASFCAASAPEVAIGTSTLELESSESLEFPQPSIRMLLEGCTYSAKQSSPAIIRLDPNWLRHFRQSAMMDGLWFIWGTSLQQDCLKKKKQATRPGWGLL